MISLLQPSVLRGGMRAASTARIGIILRACSIGHQNHYQTRSFSDSAAAPIREHYTEVDAIHENGNSSTLPSSSAVPADSGTEAVNTTEQPYKNYDSVFDKAEMVNLFVPGESKKTDRIARIVALRTQNRVPTICDAMGVNAISNAVRCFIKGNITMKSRVGIDLSDKEKRQKVARYFVQKGERKLLWNEESGDAATSRKISDQAWTIEANESDDLEIEGLEAGMRLDRIVSPLTREEKAMRSAEVAERVKSGQKINVTTNDYGAPGDLETYKNAPSDLVMQTRREMLELLETGVEDTNRTLFLFNKATPQRLAFIPTYHKHGDRLVSMRFEPLLLVNPAVENQSDTLHKNHVFPPKEKGKLEDAAAMLQRQWMYFSNLESDPKMKLKAALQKRLRAGEFRPQVVTMGREGVVKAVKLIAIANEKTKEAGGREFCVLPSYQVTSDTRPGKENEQRVRTRFDLYAV